MIMKDLQLYNKIFKPENRKIVNFSTTRWTVNEIKFLTSLKLNTAIFKAPAPAIWS